jgi:predicted PurR-regulated permease PerM
MKSATGSRQRGLLPRERLLTLALLAATALVVYVCYLLVRPFTPALVWALALAVIAYPVHVWLERRLRHRGVAAALAVALVAVTVITPAALVGQC